MKAACIEEKDLRKKADLKTVALLAIEMKRPNAMVAAMREAMALADFHHAVLMTDSASVTIGGRDDIEIIDHKESDFRPMTGGGVLDHEINAIREPLKHLKGASHIIFMEWDAGVRCPESWDESWLRYDFIGAPWKLDPPGAKGGFWPPSTQLNNVGNTGFSLRSEKFCYWADKASREFAEDQRQCIHDIWLCRVMRDWLVSKGVKFAPATVAARFSNENRMHDVQFGFHGRQTFAMNKWGDPANPVWRKQ